MDQRLRGYRRMAARWGGVLIQALASLLLTGTARAVLPESPLREHPRRPHLVGREEERPAPFRKPGTLLGRARHSPVQVDIQALRRRKLEQILHRTRHTTALPTPGGNTCNTAPDASCPAESPARASSEEEEPTSTASGGGVKFWHILVFLSATAGAVFLVLRLTSRRR